MKVNVLFNGDGIDLLKSLPDSSIKCILTDPPYLYLKNQKLDRPFDEQTFFAECKRVLTDDGFIVLFGRGTSFYRWNTILSDLNFTFKEEIVWDKSYCSSPLMSMSRVHETISIHTKENGVINKVKVPYLEMKKHDIPSIIQDIKRMRSVFKNTKSLDAVLAFLENNQIDYKINRIDGLAASYHAASFKNSDRAAAVISCITQGMNEKSIIRSDRTDCNTITKYNVGIANQPKTGDRCANAMQSITFGLNEKSIIREGRDHYTAIHPTQKPIALLKRLLALVTKPGDIVVDPFGGSFSTACACIETGNTYMCAEIDNEYYTNGANRVSAHLKEFNT